MTIKEFITYIEPYSSVHDIIALGKTQAEKGHIFERLFDIVIKFGHSEIYGQNVVGNANNGKLKKLVIEKYLQTLVISGNSGGCSDISIIRGDKYIFISSKFPKSIEETSVDYYDVQNIVAMAKKNEHIYSNYSIILLVPDKKKLYELITASRVSSQYITDHMKECFDLNDLQRWYTSYTRMPHNFVNKERMTLRFHQELILQKTNMLIAKGHRHFLWGCKCRSGKTYMAGGIILKARARNVIVITPAPTETAPQFTDELFHRFADFEGHKVHDITSSAQLRRATCGDNNIFVMSKQLLQLQKETKTEPNVFPIMDIIIFDETHYTGCTDISKKIIKRIAGINTVIIFLTATYAKPLREWNIPAESQMFWDIEDEQLCKNGDIAGLVQKHGDHVNKILEEYIMLQRDAFSWYNAMPEMHLITNMFDADRYIELKQKLNTQNKMGFCFEALFALCPAKKRFCYPDEVSIFLRYISGSNKEDDGEMCILPRIFNICSEEGSRKPFTQIWFLPPNGINEISKALHLLMKNDRVLRDYEILLINRKNKDLAKDVKSDIHKIETEALSKGRRGVILLAGSMITLGITLHQCDMVLLFNNTLSSDKVMQQMYRCMTEGPDKKIGFVVDLNISRVLQVFSSQKAGLSIADNITYLIKNRLINIDIDLLSNMKMDHNAVITKLLDIWKGDPIVGFKSLLKKLDEDYVLFDNPTQKLLNKTFNRVIPGDRITLLLKDDGDEGQDLPTGREKIKISGDDGVSLPIVDDIEDEEIEKMQVSFTKDVLPYVIPLVCILTLPTESLHLLTMFAEIKSNPDLLDTFDDQCIIWWNKKELIDVIKDIIVKFINGNNNSCSYNITSQFKLSMKSLIDSPKELLELIHECLRPKEIEKKEFGEVFTPIPIISEMLDKLPVHIWKDSSIKWLDPATGMGNFPIVIYLRLMESLREEIICDKARKKHILENMLYLCELNKKNVMVCKQIFDLNNEYIMNLHCGDTLTLNPMDVFGINKFDIIIGNPPYNKGGIRSHTGNQLGDKNETIWTKFIEKSMLWLKPEGYLAFINPLSWLKKSHSLHDMMLSKHIIWLKLWDNIKSLATINGKIPISLFLLQNKINIDKHKTIIISEIQSKKLTTSSNEYLSNEYSIPLAYHSIFTKLKEFIESNDLDLKYSTKTIKAEGIKSKLPKEYDISDMYAVDTYTIKEGILVKKAIIHHPDADKRKLIIANKASFAGAFIDEGKLSLTGNHKFYVVGDDLELIQKMLKFKIVDIISHYTKYGQDFLDNDAFSYLPDIRKLGIEGITENQLYQLIGLSIEEIKLIGGDISDNNAILFQTPKPTIKLKIKALVVPIAPTIAPLTAPTIAPLTAPTIAPLTAPTIAPIINYEIIKDGRKKLYLIKDKLYKVRRDGSVGVYVCNYNPK